MSITTSTRIPHGIWSWRSSALVLLLVLAPIAGLGVVAVRERSLIDAARVENVITAPATLVAALAFYVAWRISRESPLAWISLAFTVLACQVVVTSGLQLITSTSAGRGWSTLADLAILEVTMFCAALARRHRLPVDPAALGFLIGLGLTPPRLLASTVAPDVGLGTGVAMVSFAVLVTGTCGFLLAVAGLPWWLRIRLAAAVVCVSGANVAILSATTWTAGVTLALDGLGAAILVTCALSAVRAAALRLLQEHQALGRRLEEVEATSRVDHARMHEINATLAGITSASHVIADWEHVSQQRRAMLEEMMRSELARLQRLVAEPPEQLHIPRPRTVDLDETIGRLALAHEVRGNSVSWSPSGEQVAAEPDAVAEVINILLDNAAKHGSSAAEVTVDHVGDAVEVSVSDSGPGVSPDLRERLFHWGSRGQTSQGQGIGLHIAHQLAREQGGYLVLRDGPDQGTTFVVGLRAAGGVVPEDGHDAAHLS